MKVHDPLCPEDPCLCQLLATARAQGPITYRHTQRGHVAWCWCVSCQPDLYDTP